MLLTYLGDHTCRSMSIAEAIALINFDVTRPSYIYLENITCQKAIAYLAVHGDTCRQRLFAQHLYEITERFAKPYYKLFRVTKEIEEYSITKRWTAGAVKVIKTKGFDAAALNYARENRKQIQEMRMFVAATATLPVAVIKFIWTWF